MESGGGATFWERLRDAPSVMTTISGWWFRDDTFLTLDGSDNISDCIDCVVGGAAAHDASQSTPERRPHFNAGNGLAEVDQANTEWMALNVSTGENSDDWVWLFILDIKGLSGDQYLADVQTGEDRLLARRAGPGDYEQKDGTWRASGVTTVTGKQVLTYVQRAGTATASMRKDGAQMGPAHNWSSRALGGSASLFSTYTGAGGHLDAHVATVFLYKGYNLADIQAIEAIGAEIKADMP
jgi:hypothetical protein